MKLDGKIALVTGAGRGIGRETALACAAEGADVVLAARSVDALVEVADEIANIGRGAQVIETDVTDRVSVESMAGQALDRWRRIDLLVNNSDIAAHQIWFLTVPGEKPLAAVDLINATGWNRAGRQFDLQSDHQTYFADIASERIG